MDTDLTPNAAAGTQERRQPEQDAATASATDAATTLPTETAVAAEAREHPPQPSIEEEVKQLVGSVSSWWSGFSKRSQEQINQARAQIDAQGGIVSIAKREAQRFEAQLTEAQRAAREQVAQGGPDEKKRTTVDIDGLAASGSYTPPVLHAKDKGKGKDDSTEEGDDGLAVDRLEERMEESRRTRQSSEGAGAGTASDDAKAESLFDADSLGGIIDTKAVDEAVHAARQNAQTAIESVQTFWTKLQADPRVNNMQASVAHTLQNIHLPRVAPADDTMGSEGDAQREKRSSASVLPDLAKQFQGAFPHLDWKESQGMAKRYFEASQTAAQNWGKEMSHLVGDLVKIVPPEDSLSHDASSDAKSAAVASAPAQAHSIKAPRPARAPMPSLQAADADDDDFFDWDKEVEPRTASEGTQGGAGTGTGPNSTTDSSLVDVGEASISSSAARDTGRAAASAGNVTKEEPPKLAAQASSAKATAANDEDDDDDSDWE